MAEKRIAGVGIYVHSLVSMSNFIFASPERVAEKELFEALRREHIYVRHFTKERINNYLRISIGTREEMETFIRFLKEYLKEA